MVANAIQRTVAIDREASFGSGIADWTSIGANGGAIRVINLNIDGIRRAMLEDENSMRRLAGNYPKFAGLKNVSFSFEMYQFGTPVAGAATSAQGDRLVRDEILLNAFGGELVGFAAALTGVGTTSAPVINEGDLDTQGTFGWGFFYDDSTSSGRFRKFSTVTDGGGGSDDTVNLITGHVLPAAPAAEDVMHAVVVHYPDWDVLVDHTSGSHISSTMFIHGRDPEDNYEPRGVAFSANIGPFEAGTPVKWTITASGATFVDVEGITQPVIAEPDEGQHGPVVGSGQATRCEIANVGANLATQQFTGAITVELGVARDPDMGPNGLEGVHGYSITDASAVSTTVEVTVPFDDAWHTDYAAGTEKHLLVQVGDQPTLTHGIYFGRLAWREEPQRMNINGRVYLALRFDALEPETDLTGISATVAHRARAKFEILRTA